MSNYETSPISVQKELINKLRDTQTLSKNEWIRLIDGRTLNLPTIYLKMRAKFGSNTMGMMFMSAD